MTLFWFYYTEKQLLNQCLFHILLKWFKKRLVLDYEDHCVWVCVVVCYLHHQREPWLALLTFTLYFLAKQMVLHCRPYDLSALRLCSVSRFVFSQHEGKILQIYQ